MKKEGEKDLTIIYEKPLPLLFINIEDYYSPLTNFPYASAASMAL